MPFDGIVLRAAVSELNGLLAGGRIEKIFQTERDEIVLACHASASHYRLLISANAVNPRIHLTKSKKENPMIAPPFAMVLRKHLQGGRILSVTQSGYDRVVTLTAEIRNEMGDVEQKQLIVEIMGRHSNIILVNSQGVIHDAIKHIDDAVNRVREIMPARRYVAPPGQEKLPPNQVTEAYLDARWETASKEKCVSSWLLSAISGFSPLLCDVICLERGIEPKSSLKTVALQRRNELFQNIMTVCGEIARETFYPAIVQGEKDFHCIRTVATYFGDHRKFNTVNLMLDEFYTNRDEAERLRQRKTAVQKIVINAMERVQRKLGIHEDILQENASHEQYRIYGELLNANLYALPEYGKEARVLNYYEENAPEVVIPLDYSKTVSQNAQMYFKKYRKARSSYESTLRLKEEDLSELDYLEQVRAMLQNAMTSEDIMEIRQELSEEGYGAVTCSLGKRGQDGKPRSMPLSAFLGGKPASKKSLRAQAAKAKAAAQSRKQSEPKVNAESKPLHFITPDGYRILVGRNNRQNDRLTLRDSQPEDLWFHLHGAPGSHVILCLAEKNGVWSNTAVEMAAGLAAWYSSSRGTSKADVDYTKVKYIKKIPGGHPGMVTYTDYRTITVVPKDGQQSLPHSVS